MCLRWSVCMQMLVSVYKAIRIPVLRVCQELGKGQWFWSGHPRPREHRVVRQLEAIRLWAVLSYFPDTLS